MYIHGAEKSGETGDFETSALTRAIGSEPGRLHLNDAVVNDADPASSRITRQFVRRHPTRNAALRTFLRSGRRRGGQSMGAARVLNGTDRVFANVWDVGS